MALDINESRRAAGACNRPAPDIMSRLSVRCVGTGPHWELVHPRCARERAADLDEVRGMLNAGETDIAMDELRWLLDDCHEFLAAHRLLGELALADDDLNLARGHFGISFQLGLTAAEKATGPLPYSCPPNRDFYESGKGLIACLKQLGREEMARDVALHLLRLDPSDPLNVRAFLA